MACSLAGGAVLETLPPHLGIVQSTAHFKVVLSYVCSDHPPNFAAQQPGMMLLLARLCSYMESQLVVRVMETLAELFAGQGTASGGDQPPAFVAGEVAR